jgi:hypothetical protein
MGFSLRPQTGGRRDGLMARLVALFVYRASVARPCAPGQDSGYDGDQQRCGGGMLSECPPRYPNARF